jgi:hypothetical protein
LNPPAERARFSQALRRHILASEPAADTRLLRAQLALRPECVAVSRLAAELLKQGTAAGFNLHPIARMMARPDGSPRPFCAAIR